MNLRKLPPSMLLTLGLACGDGKTSDEATTVSACLTPDPTEAVTGPCLGAEPDTETGPCLSTTGWGSTDTDGSSSADSTFGPCLSPEPPTSTGTDTGTDTGTGGETDTEGTTGMMGDAPPSRAAAIERVLERATLPPDVAARLRSPSR
jgi:hypothetical protein